MSSSILTEMTQKVAHRGPDDEGIAGLNSFPGVFRNWKQDPQEPFPLQVALGHRRLSILDLSDLGWQPMRSPGGSLWISYNGEVYNYLELRDFLEGQGVQFTSETDTEVVLAAWEFWGADCLQRLNGMFAFLLFDESKGEFHAVRDRFGIKPLYYKHSSGFWGFASEIKQFEALPDWRPALAPQVVNDFLAWGLQDHVDDTFFEGVKQLRGGERLEINIHDFLNVGNDQPKIVKWYDPKKAPLHNDADFEWGTHHFRELLSDSVRLRLQADVPVGSCLSGGLDSSSIVCLIDRLRRKTKSSVGQLTFSARAEDSKLDEGKWIDIVLRNRDMKSLSVMPEFEDLKKELSNLVFIQDEPFGSPSIFVQHLVFGLARDAGVKVVLDGQGADEILGGYDSFRPCALAGMLKAGHWLEAVREFSSNRDFSFTSLFFKSLDCLFPHSMVTPFRAFFGNRSTGPDWLNFIDHDIRTDRSPSYFGTRTSGIRSLSEVQVRTTSLPKLLHWEDRNSMARSVEGRVPFLDHRVVELALGLPDHFKFSRGVTKLVLREAMTEILPQEIAQRRDKIGFAASEQKWFVRSHPEWFKSGIEKACDFKGIFDSDKLLLENQKMLEGLLPYDRRFWRVLCFGEWMDRFSVSVP